MLKTELLIVSLFVVAIGLVIYAANNFYSARDTQVALCEQAGGIPLMHRNGQFNVCLRADATIELTEE